MRLHLLLVGALGCGGAKPAAAPQAPVPPGPSAARPPAIVRPAPGGGAAAAPVLTAMREELGRAMKTLGAQPEPPYFLAYQVSDVRTVWIQATLGALVSSADQRARTLDVDARVGSYRRDNTHPLRAGEFWFPGPEAVTVPLDDDPAAIRAALWLRTEKELRAAREQLVKVIAEQTVRAKEEDDSDDFSQETPSTYLEAPATLAIDVPAWERRLEGYSAAFRGHPDIHSSDVRLTASASTRYFVSSEGSVVQAARTHVGLFVQAQTTADDGMELIRFETMDAPSVPDLPSDEDIRGRIAAVIADLKGLRSAPLAEPFVGPAILEGRAAGVFFHETFGHRIEGHRQRDESEGQTFAKKIGQRVMPDFIDVYDDPTAAALEGIPLNGFYRYDDEGVTAQRTSLIEAGVLRTFLLSRTPTRGFARSNGHGRREPGYPVVSRQANLIVQPRRTVSPDELKRLLLEEVNKQGQPYGLRFRLVQGGFTMTGRFLPQAFKVLPIIVFRVYPDGREELIRGADLEGTPLTALSEILAAGDDWAVFNGHCGAESGFVPVAAASPSLLVSRVEIARAEKGSNKPPILPAPPIGGDR